MSGTYRGRHVDAWFAGGWCFGIGDAKAWADWVGLMAGADIGTREPPLHLPGT